MAGSQATNQLCLTFMTMYVFSTLNLRPGMDSAANFTYILFFSDQNMKYFTLYTYNKKVLCTGLSPMMALSQPHNSHLVYI